MNRYECRRAARRERPIDLARDRGVIGTVELRDPAKNRIRFYIDRDTHLPLRMQVRRNDESKIREEQYANWHKFQDVMTPLFVTRYTDSLKTMEIRAETAVYNSGLSDDLFTQLKAAK